MKLNISLSILLAVLLVLPLSACGAQIPVTGEESEAKPVVLDPIVGTDLNRLTLTEKAAERLGLETAQVRAEQVDGTEQLVVPYAAMVDWTSMQHEIQYTRLFRS